LGDGRADFFLTDVLRMFIAPERWEKGKII
jgi:hypothetical protein